MPASSWPRASISISAPRHGRQDGVARDFTGKVLIADIWEPGARRAGRDTAVDLLKKYEGMESELSASITKEDAAAAKKLISEFAKKTMNYPCLIGDDKTRNQV